jgi:hypothetical protein
MMLSRGTDRHVLRIEALTSPPSPSIVTLIEPA